MLLWWDGISVVFRQYSILFTSMNLEKNGWNWMRSYGCKPEGKELVFGWNPLTCACKSMGKRLKFGHSSVWNSTYLLAVGRLIVELPILLSHRIRFRHDTARYGDLPRLGVPIRPLSYRYANRSYTIRAHSIRASCQTWIHGANTLKKQAIQRVISVITTIILCSSVL